jgi:hypothetical protein
MYEFRPKYVSSRKHVIQKLFLNVLLTVRLDIIV